MILLFVDSEDYSTLKIVQWLHRAKRDYIMLDVRNPHDTIDIANFRDGKLEDLNIRGKIYKFAIFKSIFFRRSEAQVNGQNILRNNNINLIQKNSLLKYLAANITSKKEILHKYFSEQRIFGNEFVGRTNKIIALNTAQFFGLQVPSTIITTSKKTLNEFILKYKKVIVKSLDLGYSNVNHSKRKWRVCYTTLLKKNDVAKLKKTFPPTMFQEYVEKSFEVRAFYFNNQFYSIAIFSQQNTKTKVDCRNYDYINPNREVPFIIPPNITEKLKLVFDNLNLNTGSVDLIVSDDKFYFLEINPVGQFDNVSVMGNWYIEKKIVEFLCHEN